MPSLERRCREMPRGGAPAGGRKLPPAPGVTRFSGKNRAGLQLAQPDVPETDQVPVVLQAQRHVAMRPVARRADVGGAALEHRIVLHQHAVEQHREPRRRRQRAVGGKTRRGEDDVVGLPGLGRPAWRSPAAETACRWTPPCRSRRSGSRSCRAPALRRRPAGTRRCCRDPGSPCRPAGPDRSHSTCSCTSPNFSRVWMSPVPGATTISPLTIFQPAGAVCRWRSSTRRDSCRRTA